MSSGLPGWNTWRDQQGLDEHGRPKATGGNGGSSATRMFFFIFYVMLEGDPLIVCMPRFSPVFQHQGTEEPTKAAFNCLQHHRLLRDGASFPTSVWELDNFLQLPNCSCICLVEVNQADLVASSSFGEFNKVYSLVNRTGHSLSGKQKVFDGFGAAEYDKVFGELVSMNCSFFTPASPPTMHQPKVSGGATALPPTGPATQIGGGGAATTSLHTILCGHDACLTMKNTKIILFPWFTYYDRVSKKNFPAVILVHRNGSWDTMCGTMSPRDKGCLYSTAERALVEQGKMQLVKNLDPKDRNNVHLSIEKKNPVFFFSIDSFVDQESKRRTTLNARVASDKSDQVIGFFQIFTTGSLVGFPGNPPVSSNVFSTNVQSLASRLAWALPKTFPK